MQRWGADRWPWLSAARAAQQQAPPAPPGHHHGAVGSFFLLLGRLILFTVAFSACLLLRRWRRLQRGRRGSSRTIWERSLDMREMLAGAGITASYATPTRGSGGGFDSDGRQGRESLEPYDPYGGDTVEVIRYGDEEGGGKREARAGAGAGAGPGVDERRGDYAPQAGGGTGGGFGAAGGGSEDAASPRAKGAGEGGAGGEWGAQWEADRGPLAASPARAPGHKPFGGAQPRVSPVARKPSAPSGGGDGGPLSP